MLRIACLIVLLVSVFVLRGSARAEPHEWIDDRSIVVVDQDDCYEVVPSEPIHSAHGSPMNKGGGRGLNDGLVGCSTSDNCSPFDLDSYATGPALDLLPEGDYPYDATMSLDGTEIWFVGASGDGAVVVDRSTNTITHRIATGLYPTSICFSDDGNLAFVSCRDTEELTRIDTSTYTVVGSLPLPSGIDGGNVALNPVSKLIYLVDWYDNTLFEIDSDGSSILRQVDVGSNLWQLVVAPDGERIYVTDRGADLVRIIDSNSLTEIDTVPVGDDPWGIDITSDGGKLVVACEDSHDVVLVDTGTLLTTTLFLHAEADPRDVDISDERNLAYVCGGRLVAGNPIYVIGLVNGTIEAEFEANGTNTNVIAVQAQMHSGGSNGVADLDPSRLKLDILVSPNPLTARTEISCRLPVSSGIDLGIFDASGRRVREIAHGRFAAGRHQFAWTGIDSRGDRLAPGVYFARLSVGDQQETAKLVVGK